MLDPDRLWVHYGRTDAPAVAEAAMVDRFVEGLTGDVRRSLIDPTAPLPFANLTFPAGRRKNHGIRGVKALKSGSVDRNNVRLKSEESSPSSPMFDETERPAVVTKSRPTQNVTETDLAVGQIRIPRVSKSLFPQSKSEIQVELGGESHRASWDPRTAGDKERSGVIRVGRGVLARHMSAGVPRTVERTANGYRIW